MSTSKNFYILRVLGILAFIFATSPYANSLEHTNDVEIHDVNGRERSIDEMLDRAEFIIHTNLDEVEALLFKISNTPKPLDQLQRHRLMLLQANQLILETEFEQADDILAQLMRQQPNTSTMIRVIYFRAHIADILENYEQAFAYLYRLDQYPRLSVSSHQQFETLALATNLYLKAHAFSLANGYAQRALSLARQGKSPQLMCYALRLMTNVYVSSKDLERAKTIAAQAIEFCNDANEPIALAGSFINLSYWYREQQDYTQQRDYISQAISLYQQQRFIVSINSSKLLLAEAFLLEDDVDNAGKIMSDIFNEVEQLNVLDDLMLAYRIKAILYENSGDSALAMNYLKKFLSAKAKVNDVSSKVHGAYLQMRFDNKINQQSVVISDIEQKNVELVNRIEVLTTFLIVASSLLLLSITFYCFTFYRRGKTILMTERSNIDELTQLYNSSYGFSLAQKMLASSATNKDPFGVVCIDLDFMSAVNNSFSYDFGDILLQAFANKVKVLVGDNGIVIRHSGDYFIAFTPNLNDEKLTDLVVELHQCLDGIMIDRQKIIVSCSIGWTIEQAQDNFEYTENLSRLIEQATQALNQAKFNGRNQWIRFDPEKVDDSLTLQDFRSRGLEVD